ncbi:MAG: twin-arginine translocase TatA/TatE family subunit [Acidobacteriota bacterium]|nr:twin-arginine translocase TatA/TatE family subunit [Acidobacteriota bacterium]
MGLDNPLHILIVLLLVALLFGAKRLPELGRSLGSGIREFKDAVVGTREQPRVEATAHSTEATPPDRAQPDRAQPDRAQPDRAELHG